MISLILFMLSAVAPAAPTPQFAAVIRSFDDSGALMQRNDNAWKYAQISWLPSMQEDGVPWTNGAWVDKTALASAADNERWEAGVETYKTTLFGSHYYSRVPFARWTGPSGTFSATFQNCSIDRTHWQTMLITIVGTSWTSVGYAQAQLIDGQTGTTCWTQAARPGGTRSFYSNAFYALISRDPAKPVAQFAPFFEYTNAKALGWSSTTWEGFETPGRNTWSIDMWSLDNSRRLVTGNSPDPWFVWENAQ